MPEKGNFIRVNYVPTPPEGENWADKRRDHDVFQLKVSLAAQLGGVSAGTGCPTPGADAARREAERLYYTRSEIHHKLILKTKKL